MDWLLSSIVSIGAVVVGWFLNQITTTRSNKRGKEEEIVKAVSRINAHLYNFILIKSSFDHIVTKDSMKALKKKLEKWKTEFEMLCSEYAHFAFMQAVLELSPFFISKIDFILDSDPNREQVKKFLDEIVVIHQDMTKEMKKFY